MGLKQILLLQVSMNLRVYINTITPPCTGCNMKSIFYKRNLKDKICNIKEFRENKICNVKEFRVKFNMMRMTLKPNLVFIWVMFLGGFSI